MSVESATYIYQLNVSLPSGSDPKSEGDDHIRLLKSTQLNTWPNILGPVTASHTELSYCVGVTSAIQTQINAKGAIAGQVWTGTHDCTGATLTVSSPTTGAQVVNKTYADGLAFSSSFAAGSAVGQVVRWNGTQWAAGNNITVNGTAKTANYSAAAGDQFPHDTSGGGFTMTLPTTPSVGDPPILVFDLKGAFQANNLTLDPGSNKVEGSSGTYIVDINRFRAFLVYSGATQGWVFL